MGLPGGRAADSPVEPEPACCKHQELVHVWGLGELPGMALVNAAHVCVGVGVGWLRQTMERNLNESKKGSGMFVRRMKEALAPLFFFTRPPSLY